MNRIFALATLVIAGMGAGMAQAPSEDSSSTEALAKATQNPVANLISVPFQNNTNFPIGPYGRIQNVLNIQPVIPIKLNDHWNLINRVIIPVVFQPDVRTPSLGTSGFGDLNPTFFLSPAKGKLIWGRATTLFVEISNRRGRSLPYLKERIS